MSLTRKWADRSFFIELKPRSDMASFFLDFPPEEDEYNGAVLDVGIDYIEYGEPVENCENVMPGQRAVETDSFRVHLEQLQLTPSTFSGGSWTQTKQRLFMCKLKGHCSPRLVYKTNHQLAEKALRVEPLKEFVEQAEGKHIGLACAVCGSNLLAGEENKDRKLTVGWVPSDDWMTLTPAVDYYCRDTCGAACDPQKHGHHREGLESESMHDEWRPTKLRIMISHTTLFVKKEIIKNAIRIDSNLVSCGQCGQHLGQRVKGSNKNILQFHHSNVSLLCERQKYLNMRFPDRSQWFSQQLLIHFESTASQKLVVRSLDKKPYILVWILDSYVSIVAGQLKSSSEANSVRPQPALKLLYKLFDTDNAGNDPRANGEDASVGILDLPLLACEDLKEALLRSSLAIPVSLRSLGQFYVSYLPLPEGFI